MSIEVGPYCVISLVPGRMEGMREALSEVRKTSPGFVELQDRLIEVLTRDPDDHAMVNRFRSAGRILIGATKPSYSDETYPFDGLLYAQGEDKKEDGTFSLVRMGTWIRETINKRDNLRQLLYLIAFKEQEEGKPLHFGIGLPVTRDTKIIPFHRPEGIPADGYKYGFRKDIEAISALQVPDALKERIEDVAISWHDEGEATTRALKNL